MNQNECKDGVCAVSEKDRLAAQKLKEKSSGIGGSEITLCLFGKKNCPLCNDSKNVIEEIISVDDTVGFEYYDLDTLEGLSKAAYYNAFDLPVTAIFESGKEVKRWSGIVPEQQDIVDNIK
jgi:hypothetical protein